MRNVMVRGLAAGAAGLSLAAALLSCSNPTDNTTTTTSSASLDGATQLTLSRQPSATSESGVAFAQQPVVQLLNDSDKVVAAAGVVITASIATGGGSLGGTVSATTSATGAATFTNLSVIGTAAIRTLSFSANGVTDVVSGPIDVLAGGATKLEVTTDPSTTIQSGIAFPVQPVVQLLNADNQEVTQAGIVISAGITSGGGTLGGTTTATTNANGAAAFTNLSITGTAGPRGITFTTPSLDPALTAASTQALTLIGGTPSHLNISIPPSPTADSGVVFSQQPIVQLLDAQNNTAAQAGIAVTASIASGGGTLTGTVTVTTDGLGNATFTNLAIAGSAGPRTLSFAANGLTGVTSGTITVSGPLRR